MSKRFITTITILIIATLMSVTSVNAAPKVAFSETSNGTVKATLGFDDGFVGGIDITFRFSGAVSVKQFNFDSKISKSSFTRDYNYNKNNNTLTVKVTTGGVGEKYNLLDNKRELSLGSIVFETSDKKDVKYSVECTKLTIIDNSWNSKSISLSGTTKKEFEYKVTTQNEDDTKPSGSTDNSSSSNSNSSSGSSVNKGSSTNQNIATDQESGNVEENNDLTSDSTVITDSSTTSPETNDQSTTTELKETNDKKTNLGLIIGGILGGIALVSGICFGVVRIKKY